MYLLFHGTYSPKVKATWEIVAFGPVSYCHTFHRLWEADSLKSVGSLCLPPSCRSTTAIPFLHCFTSASLDVTQASLNAETTNPFRTPLKYTPRTPPELDLQENCLHPLEPHPLPPQTVHTYLRWDIQRSEKQNLQAEKIFLSFCHQGPQQLNRSL